ncbi:MAG: PPOX class F420-dependent oxidoreductase [Nitriliruptorales bacterium]
MVLGDAARAFLLSAPIAHLVTLNEDGSPHVTSAWVDVDGDDLLVGTLFDQRKLRNLRRDPRVAVSFESDVVRPPGLREYLVVNGEAEVTGSGAPELLSRLAERYLGAGAGDSFPPMPDPPPGYVIRIRPTTVTGVGPWSD